MLLRTFSRSLFRRNRQKSIDVKPVDYAVCIDIECTCDSPMQIEPMEVIEIACEKLDLTTNSPSLRKQNSIANFPTFHSYVRPVVNPQLTLFCQDLTGIMQSTVDSAETVEVVIMKLIQWLKEIDLINENFDKKKEFAFASCGNFDLKLLSPIIKNCQFNNNLELPIYFKEWINVKKTFVNHKKKEWPKGLYSMMELMGEEPSGRLHSAKDDCKNLSRVVECLHLEGCKFYVTSRA